MYKPIEPRDSYVYRAKLSCKELRDLEPWGRSLMIQGVPANCSSFRFLTILQQIGEVVQYRLHRFERLAHVTFRSSEAATRGLVSGIVCGEETLFPVPGFDYPEAELIGFKQGVTQAEILHDLSKIMNLNSIVSLDLQEREPGLLPVAKIRFVAHYIGRDLKEAIVSQKIGFKRSGPRSGIVGFFWTGTPMFALMNVPQRFEVGISSFLPKIRPEILRVVRRRTTVWVFLQVPSSRIIVDRHHRGSVTLRYGKECENFAFIFA